MMFLPSLSLPLMLVLGQEPLAGVAKGISSNPARQP